MQTKTRQEPDHLAMMKNPERWPGWPYLPVKRKDNCLERKNLGVMLADGKTTTVYHVNLFSLPKTREAWKDVPQTTYATTEAVVLDGWVVD